MSFRLLRMLSILAVLATLATTSVYAQNDPMAQAFANEIRAQRAAYAQLWTGECPDWQVRTVGPAGRSNVELSDIAAAAAVDLFDAGAALCMAEYVRVQSDEDNASQRYYWLIYARELGADADAEIALLAPSLSDDEREVQEERALFSIAVSREALARLVRRAFPDAECELSPPSQRP